MLHARNAANRQLEMPVFSSNLLQVLQRFDRGVIIGGGLFCLAFAPAGEKARTVWRPGRALR